MPVRGNKPKDGPKKNRMPLAHDWILVEEIPFEDGPDLPPFEGSPLREDHNNWYAATQRWWNAVRRMPHAALWGESEWEFAFDTALVKQAFLATSDTKFASELRNRERVMGTTADYRRNLRIKYVPVGEAGDGSSEEEGSVTSLDEYRAL